MCVYVCMCARAYLSKAEKGVIRKNDEGRYFLFWYRGAKDVYKGCEGKDLNREEDDGEVNKPDTEGLQQQTSLAKLRAMHRDGIFNTLA